MQKLTLHRFYCRVWTLAVKRQGPPYVVEVESSRELWRMGPSDVPAAEGITAVMGPALGNKQCGWGSRCPAFLVNLCSHSHLSPEPSLQGVQLALAQSLLDIPVSPEKLSLGEGTGNNMSGGGWTTLTGCSWEVPVPEAVCTVTP